MTNQAARHADGLRERVQVDAGRIAYDVVGDGPPVVLTHGTPSWSYLWRELVAPLAQDYTVYLWDLPGYGDSTVADSERPSVALHAETLRDLIGHWGLAEAQPALVGHDIGGGTVLRAHLLHQVPVRQLVLLDAAVLTPWVTPTVAHMQRHLEVYRTMPNTVFRRVIAAHLASATAMPMTGETTRAYLDRYAGDAGQQSWLDQVAGFSDDDTQPVVDRLGDIAVPTQLIWGERDEWLTVEVADRLRAAIPGAELAIVPGAGHFLPEDAPEETLANLRRALDRVLPYS